MVENKSNIILISKPLNKDVYRRYIDETNISNTHIVIDFSKVKRVPTEYFHINGLHRYNQYEIFREINHYLYKIPNNIKCRVPDIYSTSDRHSLVIMEDCGSTPLYTINYNFTIYKNLIMWLAYLDTLYKKKDTSYFIKCRQYEIEAIEDELTDFVQYFEASSDFSDLIEDIVTHIQNVPMTICHRNFEQKNILIKDGESRILNVGNMCLGPVCYDLACLLYDPNNKLDSKEIDVLIKLYAMLINRHYTDVLRWIKVCKKLRWMKLIGTYSKLYIELSDTNYKIKAKKVIALLDK